MKWSKNELIAYILLFAAHSDFKESNEEKNIIISKVDMNTFQKICSEFENDNDYQAIQKIENGLAHHNFSKAQIDDLLLEIKLLFNADHDYNILERNMMLFLKKILK
jgi:thiosulfate/3-mercaptopyruvate sulfurtransferase